MPPPAGTRTRRGNCRRCALAAAAALATGCADRGAPTGPPPVALDVQALAFAPDSDVARAAVVRFSATGADSAYVLYRVDGGPEQATATVPVPADGALPIFGLPPNGAVVARVVARRGAAADTSQPVTGTSMALPDYAGRVRLVTTTGRPASGYILTALVVDGIPAVVAFDTSGQVAWARAFPGAPGITNARQQPNGDITAFIGTGHGWEPLPDGHFVELRPSGEVVREYRVPAGYYTDAHELAVGARPGDPSYLFGSDLQPTDLTAHGGAPDAPFAAHTVFRIDTSGAATAVFAARDHFTAADWVVPPPELGDFDHPNSLDVDADGGLIVSWRNVGEVSKIDPRSGTFVWRLGGPHNEFAFVNDPLDGFGGQHSARILPNGNLLLYDNGWTHTSPETRVAEYHLDPTAHTATLVWQFRHDPPLFTPFVGSAQRLTDGSTVVGYGNAGLVTQVGADGSVRWEAQLTVDGAVDYSAYRFLDIPSLYTYREP